jgi:hypothetical protein
LRVHDSRDALLLGSSLTWLIEAFLIGIILLELVCEGKATSLDECARTYAFGLAR